MWAGKMKVPYQPRKLISEAEGCFMWSTNVPGSGASVDSTDEKKLEAGALWLAMIVSKVYFTSVEVTGWPSCQVALSTIVKVVVRPSSDVSQDVASSGSTA